MDNKQTEGRYYFITGDTIVMPQACEVVFLVNGKVIYPDFKATMSIPEILREAKDG